MQHDCAEGSLRQLDKSFEQDTRFLKAGLIRCLTPINMLPPCKIYRLQGCFYHPFQAALNRYSWSHYFPPCLSYSKKRLCAFSKYKTRTSKYHNARRILKNFVAFCWIVCLYKKIQFYLVEISEDTLPLGIIKNNK